MKQFFSTNHKNNRVDIALLILRIGVAALMIFNHGLGKFQALFSDDTIQFLDPIGIGQTTSFMLAMFAEFFCSLLILLGLGTRFVSIILIINMMVIAFVVHIDKGFSGMELDLHYILAYTLLLILGSGKYSLDSRLAKKPNY